MEESSYLRQAPCPYLAIKVIAGRLLEIVGVVETRHAAME
jgi:hypothetical protein